VHASLSCPSPCASRRILAVGCGGKTWNNTPEVIEYDLADLVEQLEKSKLSCPVCGEKAKADA